MNGAVSTTAWAPRSWPQGATIGGTTRRVKTHVNCGGFGWASALAWWLAVSTSTLLIGSVLLWLTGRGAARIEDTGRTRIGPSIGWGPSRLLRPADPGDLGPVTIVGIPLGLGVLAALALIYTLGYTATAWIIGRQTERGPGAAGESSTMGTAPPGKVERRGRTGVHGSDTPCLVRGSRSSGEP